MAETSLEIIVAKLEERVEALDALVKEILIKKIDLLCKKVDRNNEKMIWLYVAFIVAVLGLIGTLIVAVI